MLVDYLGQDRVWSSSNGNMKISDMDEVYRRRACDWLLRNAEGLLQMLNMEEYMNAEKEPDLGHKLRMADRRPYSWIRRTPLFLRLSQGIPPELLRRQGGR
ncbi:hypothetical protein [Nonomuraea sp. NPDC050786]|uniref:hypothetical protein n=1 Tax=Nonomuraea sp. NPDC050786 TaxID=3154840 RepID=UPI0033DB5F00